MSIDCTSGNYRDKTSHNKQIYTLKKHLLKFENEFIDIKNYEFDGKKWEESKNTLILCGLKVYCRRVW